MYTTDQLNSLYNTDNTGTYGSYYSSSEQISCNGKRDGEKQINESIFGSDKNGHNFKITITINAIYTNNIIFKDTNWADELYFAL